MFKKVFKSIGRAFSSEKAKVKPKGGDAGDAGGSEAGTAADLYRKMRESDKKLPSNATSEKLCGITKGMSKEEIETQLTTLYRRYNRAASSLDANLRAEAEVMLDAIVELRMKYLTPIPVSVETEN